jgi:hypothetical protein
MYGRVSTACRNTIPPFPGERSEMTPTTITQTQLDDFKRLFPNNSRLQALTLQELLDNTGGGHVDWSRVQDFTAVDHGRQLRHSLLSSEEEEGEGSGGDSSISACDLAIAFVVIDVISLFLSATAMRVTINEASARTVAAAAKPILPRLEQSIKIITELDAKDLKGRVAMAKAVIHIMGTIKDGGMLGAVIGAFVGSLTWYYGALYGVTAVATIVAALATDGVALVADIALMLATFGFLVADSVNAVKTCNTTDKQPTTEDPEEDPCEDPDNPECYPESDPAEHPVNPDADPDDPDRDPDDYTLHEHHSGKE